MFRLYLWHGQQSSGALNVAFEKQAIHVVAARSAVWGACLYVLEDYLGTFRGRGHLDD